MTDRLKTEDVAAWLERATPGPWEAFEPTATIYDYDGRPIGEDRTGPPQVLRAPSGAPDDAGDYIATVDGGSWSDARLMAAAPTLADDLLDCRRERDAERARCAGWVRATLAAWSRGDAAHEYTDELLSDVLADLLNHIESGEPLDMGRRP